MPQMRGEDILQGERHSFQTSQGKIMHRAEIKIKSRFAETIFHALRQEEAPSAKINCRMEGDAVIFEIETESISNLRAALNSFIKWIDMVERVAEKVEEI
ncbi:MAG TPA: hypothetical protein ENJ70_00350 [Thermoplasmatales archaeon]|nr:hypothetical protein [Thermoplasmatales archaeon]